MKSPNPRLNGKERGAEHRHASVYPLALDVGVTGWLLAMMDNLQLCILKSFSPKSLMSGHFVMATRKNTKSASQHVAPNPPEQPYPRWGTSGIHSDNLDFSLGMVVMDRALLKRGRAIGHGKYKDV